MTEAGEVYLIGPADFWAKDVMPRIESFFDPALGLTVITFYGEVRPMDLVKCIDHYYRGQRCNLVLFDFGDAKLIGTEPEMPRQVFSRPDRYSRKGDRKAFVFPTPKEKDLRPFLQEYCRIQETGSNLDVFDSLIEANRWLIEDQEAHRDGMVH